jgi:cysteine synthase
VRQCFHERNRSCQVVAVEPNESCTLMCGEVGRHLIEGIADGFVPGIFARHRHIIDEIVAVDSDAAIAEMRRIAHEFGLFVGPSSGAHLVAARELRARRPALRHVVIAFFCDEGEKYIYDYFVGA